MDELDLTPDDDLEDDASHEHQNLGGMLSLIHILRAHETVLDLVCRLLLEKKKTN